MAERNFNAELGALLGQMVNLVRDMNSAPAAPVVPAAPSARERWAAIDKLIAEPLTPEAQALINDVCDAASSVRRTPTAGNTEDARSMGATFTLDDDELRQLLMWHIGRHAHWLGQADRLKELRVSAEHEQDTRDEADRHHARAEALRAALTQAASTGGATTAQERVRAESWLKAGEVRDRLERGE